MCNDKSCLTSILETILCLQNSKDDDCEVLGCDKPFLGPTPNLICYNTRPINSIIVLQENFGAFLIP